MPANVTRSPAETVPFQPRTRSDKIIGAASETVLAKNRRRSVCRISPNLLSHPPEPPDSTSSLAERTFGCKPDSLVTCLDPSLRRPGETASNTRIPRDVRRQQIQPRFLNRAICGISRIRSARDFLRPARSGEVETSTSSLSRALRIAASRIWTSEAVRSPSQREIASRLETAPVDLPPANPERHSKASGAVFQSAIHFRTGPRPDDSTVPLTPPAARSAQCASRDLLPPSPSFQSTTE